VAERRVFPSRWSARIRGWGTRRLPHRNVPCAARPRQRTWLPG